jgi:hypothetical protein
MIWSCIAKTRSIRDVHETGNLVSRFENAGARQTSA